MTHKVLDVTARASLLDPPRHSGNAASGGLGDTFCYSPLLKQGNTRLLRLLPHRDMDAPIQCHLFEYPLQEPNRGTHLYDALSYVWGSEDDKLPAFIQSDDKGDGSAGNNGRLLVTANLHAALSHLRDRLLERVMWIDAVCINQKDDDEKGWQVQSMAKIYACATRVIVWLGEAASDSDEALQAIQKAAKEQRKDQIIDKLTQQAIFALLERPWFQRVWVVQEVAAARQVLIKCGSSELDGFTFCLGIDTSVPYDTRPDLRGLIPPITYLVRDATFRPRYKTSPSKASQLQANEPSTFSLDVHPLGELVDMYHTRKATKRVDMVYALLGMSSDDPRTAGLLADYKTPWAAIFQKLIRFSLSDQMFVDTWDEWSVAVIQGKGHILGKVSSVEVDSTRGIVQRIRIAWKNALGHFDTKEEDNSRFELRASAKPIHAGDALLLLQGASKPTIIRPCNGYSAIIMITAPLTEQDNRGWSESITAKSPTDVVMIWDWDASQQDAQDQDYESFISSSQGGPQRPWTELQGHLSKAIRSWNFGVLLNGTERYEDAVRHLQGAVEIYNAALGGTDTNPCDGGWMEADREVLVTLGGLVVGDEGVSIGVNSFDNQTPLLWAVDKGYEGTAKLLLDKGPSIEVMSSTGQTLLSRAAEKGHEGIVKLLLDNGADVNLRELWYYDRALEIASARGHDKVVQILLEKGANVNAWGGLYFNTNPLETASAGGHDKVVQMLLEKGADVNAQGYWGGNALQVASARGHDKVVQMLLEKGADVNAQEYWSGKNALQAASAGGHDKVVQILLNNGANW
ncbi:hypothetical protein OQA88_5450 [Cercophora sp. LCS_1]